MLEIIAAKSDVKVILGDGKEKIGGGHIMITVPGFIKNKLTSRDKSDIPDFSALKMVVYDEADELFG